MTQVAITSRRGSTGVNQPVENKLKFNLRRVDISSMKNSKTNAVAETILQQLGGNQFRVMTGAKNLVASSSGLTFKVGRNCKKVTHVSVTLHASDTYAVEFFRIRGATCETLSLHGGVYADNLRDVFTEHTGLDVSL